MKSDKATVTLYAAHTAEGLAKVCRDHGGTRWYPCAVGLFFHCPLAHLGDGRCSKVKAKDWEAVMTFGEEDDGRDCDAD